MADGGHPITLVIGDYLVACEAEDKSPWTVRWYGQKLAYFAAYLREHVGITTLAAVGAAEVRRFIRHLQTEVRPGANNPHRSAEEGGLSPQTVAGYVRTLRAFFSWTVREGLLAESPMRQVRTPRTPQRAMRTFTDAEVTRLLDAVRGTTPTAKRNHCILLVLLDTGIRVSELVHLRMADLHLDLGYFQVLGKGRKERIVPLGRSSRRALSEYLRRYRPEPALAASDGVFLTHQGYRLRPNYVYRVVSSACRQAGIEGKWVGPHTCRHTFARNFLMNGGDLLTLQRILGHASLEIVKLYVNLQTDDLVTQQARYSPMDALKARSGGRR